MLANNGLKTAAALRRAAAARITSATKQKKVTDKDKASIKKYISLMRPQLSVKHEQNRDLLNNLFEAFKGTSPALWRIIDPIMAEAYPGSFYALN